MSLPAALIALLATGTAGAPPPAPRILGVDAVAQPAGGASAAPNDCFVYQKATPAEPKPEVVKGSAPRHRRIHPQYTRHKRGT
ncbi:MAG TPA: hypothetical protein VMT68_05315 [Caulobacteraceae bacterium]|nr:hypothetical protein [Caulobacteraceae bacterium]